MTSHDARPDTASDPVRPPAPAADGPEHSAAPNWADLAEIDRFEADTGRHLAGDLDSEAFRRIRLRQGVYGQRQPTDTHMIRVRIPAGILTTAGLEALADVAGRWSRGWGHLTTRQDVQFHFVSIHDVPSALRRLAAAGLTTREACGDVVRNVTACPMAGVCTDEVLDAQVAADAVTRHFLRNPIAQNLPRKFKVAASGCALDCAFTGIQDIGIMATRRDGRTGFRLLVGGGLGTAPREGQPLEPLTDPADLLVTVEAALRVWDRETTDREKRARTRLKYLVGKLGIEVFREKVLSERKELRSHPAYQRRPSQTALPGRAPSVHPVFADAPFTAPGNEASRAGHKTGPNGYALWRSADVVEQRDSGRYAAHIAVPLGDVTEAQFRALAAASRFGVAWRTTVRQNLVARDVLPADLPRLHGLLAGAGLADCGAHTAADVVSCPGAETCNLALTASRGAASAIAGALRTAGLGDLPVAINVSGCPNSCGQHQLADIGLSGQVRRVGREELPGYRVLLGGAAVPGGTGFGRYVAKVAAKRAPEAVVALVERYARERLLGERFGPWVHRVGPDALGAWLEGFDDKRTRQEAPDLYVDWGETQAFEVILGRGECAS